MNAILVHGWTSRKETFFDNNYPTASNSHWFPWLSKQLIARDIHTISVGHSCGGGFLIRFLSEENVKIKKLILVAPWIGTGLEENEVFDRSFFDFKLDENLAEKADKIVLIKSTKDELRINESAESPELLKEIIL